MKITENEEWIVFILVNVCSLINKRKPVVFDCIILVTLDSWEKNGFSVCPEWQKQKTKVGWAIDDFPSLIVMAAYPEVASDHR